MFVKKIKYCNTITKLIVMTSRLSNYNLISVTMYLMTYIKYTTEYTFDFRSIVIMSKNRISCS